MTVDTVITGGALSNCTDRSLRHTHSTVQVLTVAMLQEAIGGPSHTCWTNMSRCLLGMCVLVLKQCALSAAGPDITYSTLHAAGPFA